MSNGTMHENSDSKSVSVVYVASEELTLVMSFERFDLPVESTNPHRCRCHIQFASRLPSNKNRSIMVHRLAIAMGLFSQNSNHGRKRIGSLKPPRASHKELAAYHGCDYLDYILDTGNFTENKDGQIDFNAEFGLEDDCAPFKGLSDYVQLVAGASLSAADILRQGKADIAICWDGGRHHAQKSHASGFCYVADCVLAILALKKSIPTSIAYPRKKRVMYLDLDLHFSDAVSQAFHAQQSSTHPQILTLSIHHAAPGFFPDSPLAKIPSPSSPDFDPLTLSLPLHHGAANRTFAAIWPIVERVKDTFNPDYTVIQCGVDGLAGDPHSTWNWSLGGGDGSLGWCVDRIINRWSGRKLLLGGGGYNNANAARAWTYLTSIAIGEPLSLETEIPDHIFFPQYAPSFTLDVSPGNMQDQNTQEYLQSLNDCFEHVIQLLEQRMEAARADVP